MRRLLRPLLAELRPDVLHSHQIGALLYAGAAARAVGVPVVVHTEHGNLFGDRARTRWLGRLAARYADRFFCVSREIAEDAFRLRITSRRKVLVMSNGIDTAKFSCRQGTAPRSPGIADSPRRTSDRNSWPFGGDQTTGSANSCV